MPSSSAPPPGTDLDRCLKVFDVLESEVLDHGDLDMVFGPEFPIDEDGHEWVRQLKVWTHQRERGYPTIRERKAAVAARARELEAS